MENSTRKKVAVYKWNTLGSLMSASQTFLFLIAVQRICGSTVAGGYNIGYAIAQLMWTIGVFEATTYFATDIKGTYSPEQYLSFKLLTCAAMVLASVVYIWTFHFSAHDALIALILCAFKLVDAFNSYFYALFQRVERLDISGFGLFWQNGLATIVFIPALMVTKNLAFSLIVATAAEVAFTFPYYFGKMRSIAPLGRLDWSWGPLFSLFVQLLPLFLSTFLANYLSNIPKYSLESFSSREVQAAFNILFMPSFVINLFVQFVLRPSLTTLSELWASRDVKAFMKRVLVILGCTTGVSILILWAALPLGLRLLEMVYATDLKPHQASFLVVLCGGGIMAACTVLYNCLVIIRKQQFVLGAYALATVVGLLIANQLVQWNDMLGASLVYLATASVLLLSYLTVLAASIIELNGKRGAQ